jgi:integrase
MRSTPREGPGVVPALLYILTRRMLELVALRFRSRRSKDLEIVVLRHELSILRRQVARPGLSDADRVFLAAASRVLPRRRWSDRDDPGWLFLSHAGGAPRPLTMNATSLMLTRRYHAGGGSLRCFGSHRIRHATATLLVNNGMPLEEVSRYLGHSSTVPTRRYALQTPEALGVRAADALARAGLVAS